MAIALRVEDLVPNMIAVRERLRPLSEGAVTDLMQSMGKIGLVSPILIARPNGISPELVSGAHRLEAAKRLKWKSIPCVVYEGTSADERQLAEIDENLVRSDLSPAERAAHIAARKEIYERQNPEAKVGAAPGKAGGGKKAKKPKSGSFAADTAKKTGRSRSSVTQDATRAKRVPRIVEAAGTSLDSGEELDALGKLPVEDQGSLIDRAKAGEKVSARPAPKPEGDWWVPQIRALFIVLSKDHEEAKREEHEVELERLIDEIVGRYRQGQG